jgi:hypothetical protein
VSPRVVGTAEVRHEPLGTLVVTLRVRGVWDIDRDDLFRGVGNFLACAGAHLRATCAQFSPLGPGVGELRFWYCALARAPRVLAYYLAGAGFEVVS